VETGVFAKKWLGDYKKGLPLLKKLRKEGAKHDIEITGAKIRALFDKTKQK
jgi:ketol-acid reductoisomerase